MSAIPVPFARTCVVTGATSGIGKAIARTLARLQARVIIPARTVERAETIAAEISRETVSRKIEPMLLDVSSRESIRRFAEQMNERFPRVDILINNAGIWAPNREESVDGIELTWATNVLGYFHVTKALMPMLLRAAPARIVNVASAAAGGLDLEDPEFKQRPYNAGHAYRQSKQANRMFTWALARRLAGSQVTANAMNPGAVDTKLLRVALGSSAPLGRKPETGADTAIWLAAANEVEGRNGLFWADRKVHECEFRNEEQEERLWALCESQIAG
jgi:NAD(P)-dependent dehydrogenase (short-subunit alcohol dehydrogenase family)